MLHFRIEMGYGKLNRGCKMFEGLGGEWCENGGDDDGESFHGIRDDLSKQAPPFTL